MLGVLDIHGWFNGLLEGLGGEKREEKREQEDGNGRSNSRSAGCGVV